GKNASSLYRAVCREARPDRKIDHPLIEHGQCPRQTHADRARMAVRLSAELGRAAAEDLAFCEEMGVYLKSDHPFKRIRHKAPFLTGTPRCFPISSLSRFLLSVSILPQPTGFRKG